MIVTNEGARSEGDLTGQRCGDSYEFVKLLGEGGMGQVWLCVSESLGGRLAASKVLLKETSNRPESIARFRAEVSAAGRIDDPHIVEIYDTGRLADGRLYFLMEHCSGGSLADLLQSKGPLGFDLALTIGAQIASALVAAHKKQITHRDVKPANILLIRGEDGFTQAKLADFGIAKLHIDHLDAGFRTGTMKILGSPGYMAPEQANPKVAIDHRADVYAFFSVFYEMITGQRPYESNSLYDLINSVISNAPFPRPGELRRDLPPGWGEIILAGLAHRRDDRIELSEAIPALARRLPNGTALLSYAAPRFVDKVVAPTSPTISDGIGAAATQWVGATMLATASRRRSLAPLGAAMAAGLLIGGTGVAILDRVGSRDRAEIAISSDAGDATPRAAHDAEVPRVAEGREVPRTNEPAADSGPTRVAESTPPDATRSVDPPVAPVVSEPSPPVGADRSTTTPSPIAGESIPSAPSKASPTRARPKPEAVRPRVGDLVITAHPFAEVTIDGVKVGDTPIRRKVSVGPHTVVLENGDKRAEVNVQVTGIKETTVFRSW